MKLKDIEDDELFTWWTLVDRNEIVLGHMSQKTGDIYEKYKNYNVLKIYDIDIDENWENNYITVMIEDDENDKAIWEIISKGDTNV